MSPARISLISLRSFECIWTIRPTLSFLVLVEFITPSPTDRTPEYTLINVNVPTNGSVAILKARAEKGSSSDEDLLISTSSSSGNDPLIALTSFGAGRYSIAASRTACTPLFLKAEPQKAGTISFARVLTLIPSLI